MPMGTVIRLLAIACSGIVGLGFAGFAVDELERGSKHQQRELAAALGNPEPEVGAVAPTPSEELAREAQQDPLRETVDDLNDVLLAPFADVVDSDNAWVNRAVPTVLGLLLYGVGLGMVANAMPRERRRGGDWREARG